jgi:hypothetical protein
MKRFTRRLGGEVFVLRENGLIRYSSLKSSSKEQLNAALAALCRYEDTGLTPTEVAELKRRLELLSSHMLCDESSNKQEPFDVKKGVHQCKDLKN